MSGKLILNLKRKRSALETNSANQKIKIPHLQQENLNCTTSSTQGGQIINQFDVGVTEDENKDDNSSHKLLESENNLKTSYVTKPISVRNINDINNDVLLYYNQKNNQNINNLGNFNVNQQQNSGSHEATHQSRHSPEKLDAICSKIADVCKGQQQRSLNLNQRLSTENHARNFQNDNNIHENINDNRYDVTTQDNNINNENFVRENRSVEVGERRNRDEYLKLAIERLNELQEELYNDDYDDSDDDEEDYDFSMFENSPETLGYAVCVKETMAYLAAQGMTPDNPLIINLRNSLIDALPM